jgi:protein-S-isoprenylcysteine O-methyltransferase Ste14
MGSIYLCIALCCIIWIINGIWIIQAIRDHIISEIYMHIGLGIFFSVFVLELTIGIHGTWMHFDHFWLGVIGWFLYIPSAILVISSIIELSRKGKPKSADFTATTTIINSGIYGYIRQPMTLGMAIWSVALILVFQSVLTIILSLISLFCFRMSAIKESEYNIKKFGDDYKEYMKKVPMWNILKGVRK